MFQLFRKERMWRAHDLKSSYDVVIIGAGVHGLATAYYLGKEHGIKNIALLERSYLGSGNSGRNTAIIRANYRTPEGIPFYAASVKLYEELSQELQWNMLFNQCGHLTLAHTDSAINGLRVRAETNRLLGVDSRLIYPAEIKKLVPNLDCRGVQLNAPTHHYPRYPILAALYHPPGGIIRHDAVIWGYARSCDRMGIEIHPFTEAVDIKRAEGGGRRAEKTERESGRMGEWEKEKESFSPPHPLTHSPTQSSNPPSALRPPPSETEVMAVITNRGKIDTKVVVNCTAGWASTICKMVGVELPIVTHPLQACVTEPLKPFLDKVIVSSNLHVYVNQTDRGELVIGAEIDPYQSYSMKGTLPTLEQMATYTLELFPQLHGVKVLRQWAGTCDMTPDYSPIISGVEGLKGFYLDVGWGTYGFKAGPIAGRCLAELMATGKTPKLIEPFALSRFYEERLVGEKAAAAVSH